MTVRAKVGSRAATAAIAGWAVACGAAFPTSALAQTVTQEVAVSVGGSVATNPYLEDDDQGASVGGTVEIRPRLTYDTSVTRFDLEAFAQGTAFVDKYGFEDDYGVSAGVNHRASERLGLRMNAGVSSLASPATDSLWSPDLGGVTPSEPLPPQIPVDDVTVLGQRGRSTSISAGAGAEYIINAQNSVDFEGSYQDVSLTHPGTSDYNTIRFDGRYTRVLSERASVGLIAGYRRFNYDDTLQPDARSITALGSISWRLGEAWSLTASAGAQRTRTDESATAPAFTHTSLTANATLCRSDERERLCLDYSRQAQPTGLAGIRNTDAASLSYNVRVSESDTVSLGGSYSRSSGLGSGVTAFPAMTFAGVRGDFQHRFNSRLSGYAEVSVDRIRRSGLSVDPRVRVGAGVRYLLGRTG